MGRLFRWQGLVAFVLLIGALVTGWLLFGDWLVRTSAEEAGTELLGTQVDIEGLRVLETETAIELRGLAIADPFDPMRDLLHTGAVRIDLDPRALLERKYVVTSLRIDGLGFDTPRRRAARPARPDGFAAQTLAQLRQWREQFDIPALVVPRIDTVRQLALDPSQLASVQAATALAARADSLRSVLEAGARSIAVAATVDSAQALLERLQGQTPASLGIDGTRRAVADLQRLIGRVDSARAQVERLATDAVQGVRLVESGIRSVDSARLADFALARRMLSLPSFDAPELGRAMFGNVSLDRFQEALYWLALAREHLPPGLDPETRPGPSRLRLDGSSVRFPKAEAYPSFLLEAGRVDLSLRGGDLIAGEYRLEVADLTTEPTLVGRPTIIRLRRTSGAAGAPGLSAGALLDHRAVPARDSVALVATALDLPAFDLPGLPFRVVPGQGDTRLAFRLAGDQLRATWRLRAASVSTAFDSARAGPADPIEQIIARVVATLPGLEVQADLDGPVTRPSLRVRSNLDALLASRLRGVAGEELARAEALARAMVDSVVEAQVAPVRARADSLRLEATRRVEQAMAELEDERARLNARLQALGAGAIGDLLPGLPGLPGGLGRPRPSDSGAAPGPADTVPTGPDSTGQTGPPAPDA